MLKVFDIKPYSLKFKFQELTYQQILNKSPQRIKNKKLFKKCFHSSVKTYKTEVFIGIFADMLTELAESIKNIKDSKIKHDIKQRINTSFNKDKVDLQLNYCQSLTDAYNVLKSKYSIANGQVQEYLRNIDAASKKEFSKAMQYPLNILCAVKNSLTKRPDLVEYSLGIIDLKNESRLEALKKYISEYSEQEKKMVDYMYSKYYFSRLSRKIKAKCKQFSDDFGIKLFVRDEKKQQGLDYLYNELLDWQLKSKNNAILPNVIDLSQVDKLFLGKTVGLYEPINKRIQLKRLDSIRHEMIHNNDSKFLQTKFISECFFEKIKINKLYEDELIKAGLDKNDLNSIYKNREEFIAYAGEGDCSVYSDEFRSVLKKLGLPEYVFDLKPLKRYSAKTTE